MMTLAERIAALRNENWDSPFFAMQQFIDSKRQQHQLISFGKLLKLIYRSMTGRLNRPSAWEAKTVTRSFNPTKTLAENYKEEVAEPTFERVKTSQNHIGLFSILTVGIFDFAEHALRGNFSRHNYIRRRLSLFTLPLWGIMNVARAAFGVIAAAIALLPAAIFHYREKTSILKSQQEIAAREYEYKCDRNIENILKTFSAPCSKRHVENRINMASSPRNNERTGYWRIKEKDKTVTAKYKTKPVSKNGSYDAVYCNQDAQQHLATRMKETVGERLIVGRAEIAGDKSIAGSANALESGSTLENVSFFKAPVLNKISNSKTANRKFIYIP